VSWSVQHLLAVGIEPTTLGLLDPRSNQLSYASRELLGRDSTDAAIGILVVALTYVPDTSMCKMTTTAAQQPPEASWCFGFGCACNPIYDRSSDLLHCILHIHLKSSCILSFRNLKLNIHHDRSNGRSRCGSGGSSPRRRKGRHRRYFSPIQFGTSGQNPIRHGDRFGLCRRRLWAYRIGRVGYVDAFTGLIIIYSVRIFTDIFS
jgi:hypothetical protein